MIKHVKNWLYSILFGVQLVHSAPSLSDPRALFPVVNNELKPTKHWLNNEKPYPTNAWFINFVLESHNNQPSEPVNLYPYLARIESEGISLSYPGVAFYAEPAFPTIISALFYPFSEQIKLGAKEPMNAYGVSAHNGAQVSLEWQSPGQKITSSIIQGSPFITQWFTNTTVQLSTPLKWLSINQQTTQGLVAENTRYELVLALNDSQSQTWLLYTQKPITFTWDGQNITANHRYNGWIRLVLQQDSALHLNNSIQLLDKYSQTIPLNYKKNYSRSAHHLNYSLQWVTQNQQQPLMLSLPHHRKSQPVVAIPSIFVTQYKGIKGLMQGETTMQWDMQLPLPEILFLEPKGMTATQKKQLQNTLAAETKHLFLYPFPDDGPYRTGKRLARAARLALIAQRLGDHTIQRKLVAFIEGALIKKMRGQGSWHFQYDLTWGGIIPSIDDYGARNYTDHHFHYGYWVYTFAVIAYLDPSWLDTPISGVNFTAKHWVESLIRDYANPQANDPYFPMQRHQDDYVGHSWASGLTAFTDGPNQQSVSEAVNAYYAVALYGKAIHNKELLLWGQFLTAREIQAAQLYWQVRDDSPIYDEAFRKYNKVVANLWGSKVDANAFFIPCHAEYRCGLEYSFGIVMLPFTAMTTALLDKKWLTQAYPVINTIMTNGYGVIPDSWRWLLLKGVAGVLSKQQREDYFQQVLDSTLDEYDNGDSKTNTLLFLLN